MKRIGKMMVCILLSVCIIVNTTYSAYSMEIAGAITAGKVFAILLGIAGTGAVFSEIEHEKKLQEEFDKAFEEAAGEYKPNDPKDPRNQFEEILKKIKRGMRQVEIPDELWSCVTSILGTAHEENKNVGSPPSVLDGKILGSAGWKGVKNFYIDFGKENLENTSINMPEDVKVICFQNGGSTIALLVSLNSDSLLSGNVGWWSSGGLGTPKKISISNLGTYYQYVYYSSGMAFNLMSGVDYYASRNISQMEIYNILNGNIPDDVLVLCEGASDNVFNMSDYMKDALSKFNPYNYDIVNDNTSYVENNYMTNNRVIDIPDDFEELLKKLNDNTISLEEFLKNFNVTPTFKVDDTDGDGDIDAHDKVTNNSRDKNGVPATVNNNNISAKFNLAPYTYTQLRFYFPFCLPWDFYAFFVILCEEPKAPVFEWTVPLSALSKDLEDYDFKVDLSPFDDAAKTCRQLMLFCFCVGLIFATREFI